MFIVDDVVAEKMLHADNIPKHLHTYAFLDPIIGKTSLVTVSGDYWKKVRKMFNPAFATSHLETLVPGIIEEVMVFVDKLDNAATSGKVLELGSLLPVCGPVRVHRIADLLEFDYRRYCTVMARIFRCLRVGFCLTFGCIHKRETAAWPRHCGD